VRWEAVVESVLLLEALIEERAKEKRARETYCRGKLPRREESEEDPILLKLLKNGKDISRTKSSLFLYPKLELTMVCPAVSEALVPRR
jgi:hypothetical protein